MKRTYVYILFLFVNLTITTSYSQVRSEGVEFGTEQTSILSYSHPTQVLTFHDSTGVASIEMSGGRNVNGESIGWITFFNKFNRIMDLVVVRDDSGRSGSLKVRTNNGNGGTNSGNMVEQFTVTSDGDVYLNDHTNGIIMTSPNGQCWKVTIDNTGSMSSALVICP